MAHVPYEVFGGEDQHVAMLEQIYKEIGYEVCLIPNKSDVTLSSASRALLGGNDHLWSDSVHGVDFIHLHNLHPILGPSFLRWIHRSGIPAIMTIHNHRFYCTNGLALKNGEICKACRGKLPWRSIIYNCNNTWKKTAYHAIANTEIQLQNLLLSTVKLFIAPSPYVRNELIEAGVPKEKIRLVMHPVNSSKDEQEIEYDVIYAGRLSVEKGLPTLLECARVLPNLKFVISGQGPLASEVAAQTKKISNLSYFPSQTHIEVLKLISKSRVGCIASICNETFSLFALECFLSGKNAVVPDLESTEWLSRAPFFGTPANTRSIDSLVRAIQKVVLAPPPSCDSVAELREKLSLERFKNEIHAIANLL